MSHLQPVTLRCEYQVDPIAVGTAKPRFTWELAGDGTNLVQTAYRVIVADHHDRVLWDSGRVASRDQHAIYTGRPLRSRMRGRWQVEAWEGSGAEPGPTAHAAFEVGLLRSSDWQAQWIADPERQRGSLGQPAPMVLRVAGGVVDGVARHRLVPTSEGRQEGPRPSLLRREFELPAAPERARIYGTARGLYRLEVNGCRVGDALLRPGWTEYSRRFQYQTYDVTELLRRGANVIGAELADGWYSGRMFLQEKVYGDHPSLLLQCEVALPDGEVLTLVSGPEWQAAWGPIQSTDMLLGEVYDACQEKPGWSSPGDAGIEWRSAAVERHSRRLLVPEVTPVKRIAQVPQSASTGDVYDFGQNLVGRLRLRVRGERGARIRLRHAEVLEAGSLYTENLRSARCIDEYVLRGGDDEELFEPEYAFRGFRYAAISVVEGTAQILGTTATVIQSDMGPALEFECSNDLVNRLHSNILWSQRGNFVDVPTDCPQRDERLGWMGDAQVFVDTACFNMECAAFLGEKWLQSVVDSQDRQGGFTEVSPMPPRLRRPDGTGWLPGSPAWADAGVIVPWVLYEHYGDLRQLARVYPAMRRHVDYVHRHNPDLLWEHRRGDDPSDWLAIEEETPKEVVATAYFARSTQLTAAAAAALGLEQDARELGERWEQIREAFQRAFVATDGHVRGDTQTAYALALTFDLLPESVREAAGEHLLRRLESAGWHLRTGFLGVGLLLPALEQIGRPDVAHRLLVNRGFPSWGYSIDRGATTIWERWDGWTEDKGFQDPVMNSFNHYSLGSVGAWIYSRVGGIAPDRGRPGFGRAIVKPLPSPETGIKWARMVHRTVRGPFACSWRVEGGRFKMDVQVPPNATALVYQPGDEPVEVGSGDHKFASVWR